MADKTIDWIRRQESIHPDKPWIVYYAPSGHKPPIGVPNEFSDRYRGKFDDGYDKPSERILARQKEVNVVPANTKLAPRPETLPAWEELNDKDKKVGARWMEVFSGAVEHTDYQIGRIVDSIEQVGDLDNTLITSCVRTQPIANSGICKRLMCLWIGFGHLSAGHLAPSRWCYRYGRPLAFAAPRTHRAHSRRVLMATGLIPACGCFTGLVPL